MKPCSKDFVSTDYQSNKSSFSLIYNGEEKYTPSGYNSFTGSEWGRQDQSCPAYLLHSRQSWIWAVGMAEQETLDSG